MRRRTIMGGGTATAVGAVLALAFPGAAAADEPPDTRTESSTTVTEESGARTVTLFTGPVQLRNGAEWVAVDLTLHADPDGIVRPAASLHDLALTPTGPVVHFTGGGSATLDWAALGRTEPLPAPLLDGHRATYPQVAPGYDLVVEATRVGFVASLRRAGTAAGPAPTLALQTTAPTEQPASMTETVPTDAAAASLPGTESAVSRVVAAAPPADPAPIPFDTTVQTTVLRSDTSGDPDLRLGSYDGTTVARSYLVWDLAEIAGREVTSARLRVHQEWSASCAARAWEVWSSPAAGPGTLWAGQPVAEHVWAVSTDTRGHSAACAAGWTEVDVTGLLRSWAAEGVPSGTMQLRAADEADPLSWKRFGSAESPNVPELAVTLA